MDQLPSFEVSKTTEARNDWEEVPMIGSEPWGGEMVDDLQTIFAIDISMVTKCSISIISPYIQGDPFSSFWSTRAWVGVRVTHWRL